MKVRLFILSLVAAVITLPSCDDETLSDILQDGNLTEEEVASGLREALRTGTDTAVSVLNVTDGYFARPSVKILFPDEAKVVESTLRGLSLDKVVDDAILSMNRAAEDAASEAKPIFVDAITSMSIADAFNILNGDSVAATNFLQANTYTQLQGLFQPKIKTSLDKVNATAFWTDVINTYNAIPLVNPVNPNLEEHVTEKALDGLFLMVSQEEIKIRKDPIHQVSELLKKVFGSL